MNAPRRVFLQQAAITAGTLAMVSAGCENTTKNLPSKNTEMAMSPNKQTVQKYMNAFNRSDHAEILSCLTEDVEWLCPGTFHLTGKEAFDKEIENPAFVGRPKIVVTRMLEENNVVCAEGTVQATKKEGATLNLVFCDLFAMRDAKIKQLTSYLMEVKA